MAEETDIARLTDRLRRMCSRREYCCQDILKKATAALDGDQAQAEIIVETLVNEKYIDDLRFASAFARDKSSIAGWGDTKIRYMLAAKGIQRDVIALALGEVDRPRAQTRLEKLLANRLRALKDDPHCRLKMLRFALGRGYGYDETAEVLDRLMKNDDMI